MDASLSHPATAFPTYRRGFLYLFHVPSPTPTRHRMCIYIGIDPLYFEPYPCINYKLESQMIMRSQVEEKFSDFVERWVRELEELVEEATPKEEEEEAEVRGRVSRVTAHLKQYYRVKWAGAEEDVLAFFSAGWESPLERAHSWVTGWKPSMAFRAAGAGGLSEEQAERMEKLRARMKAEEEKVEREMERQQMAMADHHMVRLSRSGDAQVQGLVQAAINRLLAGLHRTMKAADCVRLRTLKGILELLTPLQCLNFLASISLTQIRLRHWGKPNATPKLLN